MQGQTKEPYKGALSSTTHEIQHQAIPTNNQLTRCIAEFLQLCPISHMFLGNKEREYLEPYSNLY